MSKNPKASNSVVMPTFRWVAALKAAPSMNVEEEDEDGEEDGEDEVDEEDKDEKAAAAADKRNGMEESLGEQKKKDYAHPAKKDKKKAQVELRPLMFDFCEENDGKSWTDYGEELPDDFIRDTTKQRREQRRVETKAQKAPDIKKEELRLLRAPFTTKNPIVGDQSVDFVCDVRFIDFEGRTRPKVVSQCDTAPQSQNGDRDSRRLLLDIDSREASQERAPSCKLVSTPSIGEFVDINTDSSVKKVALHGSVFDPSSNRLFSDPHTIGDNIVLYVEGELHPPTRTAKSKLDTLHPIALDGSAESCRRTVPEQLVSEGEVDFVNVKQAIADAGLAAKFYDGVRVRGRRFRPKDERVLKCDGPPARRTSKSARSCSAGSRVCKPACW